MRGSKRASSAGATAIDPVPVLRWLRWLKRLTAGVITLIAVLCLVMAAALLYLRSQALPVSSIEQTSVLYDINGNVIDSFYNGQNRILVSLNEISPNLVNATLAVEDHRFFDHFGIDLKGTARAVWVDVSHFAKVQGASTITQQLARNLYLSHERTWTRKIKEGLYAIQLEIQNSKEDILQQYLNQIYYGHAAYGIESASQLYYGKHAKDLTLAESAMLAGVPKGPKYYSPYMDMDNAKARQKVVLEAMVRYGYINQQQADQAYAEQLAFKPLVGDQPSQAPYFRDYIQYIAVDKLGIDEKLFNAGGLKIYTSLDLNMQKAAEQAVKANLDEEDDLQAALIAIDPRNGYIKAMVGGKDYAQNQFNRVFSSSRQPGSSFKAILYLTALESRQVTAVTRIKSEPTTFTYDDGRKTYNPSNFAEHYAEDFIDLREAIAKSDNIYAVQTIMNIGAQHVIDTARKLGINSPMQPVPSLALGTFPVSPFEMAAAYGVIANQGVKVEPTAILKIEDTSGKILYEANPQKQQIIDPAYTYVLTSLLESVFEEGGTGYRVANTIKRPVAGKTGTTDSDAWMIGFTPELTTAVWVGHDRGKKISTLESYKAAPIFARFTEQALASIPPKLFPIPQGIVSVYIDPDSGKLATDQCPNARLEQFVAGTEPTEYCDEHGPAPEESGEAPAENEKQKQPANTWWEDLKRWWND